MTGHDRLSAALDATVARLRRKLDPKLSALDDAEAEQFASILDRLIAGVPVVAAELVELAARSSTRIHGAPPDADQLDQLAELVTVVWLALDLDAAGAPEPAPAPAPKRLMRSNHLRPVR